MTRIVHCKKEPYDVYIGRPSKWGNPFRISKTMSRERAIMAYRIWLLDNPLLVADIRRELKDKVLGCYCYPLPCHGNILAEMADAQN